MATKAHCAYAFECLAASFEHRQPLSLAQVEKLWERYHVDKKPIEDDREEDEDAEGGAGEDDEEDEEMTDAETMTARPAAISRLLSNKGPASAASSSSSLPSSARSTTSSTPSGTQGSSGTNTPASSRSSLFSSLRGRSRQKEEYPLFVTWNTVSRNGYKSLRGCIGTFEPQELESGLRSYALTSAFEDVRFPPIPPTLITNLSAHITLLINFSQPTKDPLDWTLGTHGLRISFTLHGRRYGATYLPDVAKEQGWTKEETLVSLMRKAGWNGGSSSWQKTWREGKGELVRYEGKQVGLHYPEWREWRSWVEKETGWESKPLN